MTFTTKPDSAYAPRPQDAGAPPPLKPVELARWTWRQLTSMRTALLLLFLLALAAIPGSVIPQENVDTVRVSRWQDQHQELWEMLVPSRGAASTVQGEVIRIAGKVADEIDRNGGANWDADYRRMTRAFLAHVAAGAPLPETDRERAAHLVAQVRDLDGAGAGLCELAVAWVRLNPNPVSLPAPDYDR